MASLQQILSWFKTGLFPNEDQFRQTWLSYWHKSEKIPQSQIFGLQETIESATRGLIYQNPVTNVADLYTTYPNAKVGWAAMVTSEGYIYSYNGTDWANTGLKEFPEDVATQEDLNQSNQSFLPDRSFSGNVNIDYNHLCNFSEDGTFIGYIENIDYDTAWVQIYDESTHLNISGVTIVRRNYFSALSPEGMYFISYSTNPIVPDGAKMCLITLRKSDNPDGYIGMKATQEGMGTTVSKMVQTNQSFLPDRSFSGNVNIDYNHLCNISSEGKFTGYIENPLYDTAWVLIFQDTGNLKISGVTIVRRSYFSSLTPDASSFISQQVDPAIPAGSKLALITLRKSDNPDGYLDMSVDQQGAGVSKSELKTQLVNESRSFLPDRSFSNYPNIDYNHLWNIPSSGTPSYVENANFDTAWVQIYDDSGSLDISGAVVTGIRYFSALQPDNSVYIGSGTKIPAGSKLALVTLRKSDNPDGYLDMNVKQDGSGITRKEINVNTVPQFIQKVTGKNLINPDDLLYGWTYSSSTGLIQSDNGILSNKMILSPGTLTVQGIQPYSGNQNIERILLFNDKDELINAPSISLVDGKGTYTVTCGSAFYNVVYCRLVLQYNTNVLFNKDVAQFEYGNEATAFEACKTKLVANPAYEREQRMCFLTGASSSVPANGYFENACRSLGYKHRNVAVSGENVMQHADKAWKGTLYTPEELEEIDIFITSHIHNYNVAYTNPGSIILHDTVEEYEQVVYDINGNRLDVVPDPSDPNQFILPTQGYASQGYYPQRDDVNEKYAAGYDYLLKKYIKDCYELRNNPDSKYYGTVQGKPVVIVMCTQWHDGYVVYNNAVKEVAARFGAVVCDFSSSVGFSYRQTDPNNPDSVRQSALLCTNRLYGSGNDFQDININGVVYTNMGWHPTRDINSYFSVKRGNILADVLKRITF